MLIHLSIRQSGDYWVDPDGVGVGSPPVRVHCDMRAGGVTRQSGALSLVEIVEIVLSLVETFIELKFFMVFLHQLSCALKNQLQSPLFGASERKITPYPRLF